MGDVDCFKDDTSNGTSAADTGEDATVGTVAGNESVGSEADAVELGKSFLGDGTVSTNGSRVALDGCAMTECFIKGSDC